MTLSGSVLNKNAGHFVDAFTGRNHTFVHPEKLTQLRYKNAYTQVSIGSGYFDAIQTSVNINQLLAFWFLRFTNLKLLMKCDIQLKLVKLTSAVTSNRWQYDREYGVSNRKTWQPMVSYGQQLLLLLFVSFLSHFWLIHLFYLHLLYQPYGGLCQATCVQSHQRQPTSAVAIATCEVQVSAADYQTAPTIATGVSKPLCCRLTLTFTLTSENLSFYITLLL